MENVLLAAWRAVHGTDADYRMMGRRHPGRRCAQPGGGPDNYLEFVLAENADMGARDELSMRYAWAVPTDEALDTIGRYGPVVEVGAGTGYWAGLLRARGVDVVAYDIAPPPYVPEGGGRLNAWHPSARQFSPVWYGDGKAVVADYPDRTLLLCWPPPNDPMAAVTLARYGAAGGRRVVFVGESSTVTGDDRFHDMLDEGWRRVGVVALPQWLGNLDGMTIYESA